LVQRFTSKDSDFDLQYDNAHEQIIKTKQTSNDRTHTYTAHRSKGGRQSKRTHIN